MVYCSKVNPYIILINSVYNPVDLCYRGKCMLKAMFPMLIFFKEYLSVHSSKSQGRKTCHFLKLFPVEGPTLPLGSDLKPGSNAGYGGTSLGPQPCEVEFRGSLS